MRRIIVAATPGVAAATRIAMLPGAYHEPEDFEREGFTLAVRSRGLHIDLEFIAPELRHLTDRTIMDTLQRDVIDPARAAGCRAIWLGGVSLGGFLALSYAERNPGALAGLCLLAPYLGTRLTTGEIARAGGVTHWNPEHIAAEDEERRVWRYIRQRHAQRPQIRLGMARQDRFGHGHRLFAEALPREAVNIVDGGHDWATWRALWALFLDQNFPQGTHRRDTL